MIVLDPQGRLDLSVPSTEPKPTTYAIIGTRSPDQAQIEVAKTLAFAIACLKQFKVRTGGAYGVDKAAMEGTGGHNLEVFLPWGSYNRDIIPVQASIVVYDPKIHDSWTASIKRFHPNPFALSYGSVCLHARNFGIISDCKAVIALPNETGGGGTGQGIRIAKALGIPVIQGNKTGILDAPRWTGKALQLLGLASKDLAITIRST